jgi:hypothetical protein
MKDSQENERFENEFFLFYNIPMYLEVYIHEHSIDDEYHLGNFVDINDDLY